VEKKIDNKTRLKVLELALEDMYDYSGYICPAIQFALLRSGIVSPEEERNREAIFCTLEYFPEILDYKPKDVGMHKLYGWFGPVRLKENRDKRVEVMKDLIDEIKLQDESKL
jgi:hypothetical protein